METIKINKRDYSLLFVDGKLSEYENRLTGEKYSITERERYVSTTDTSLAFTPKDFVLTEDALYIITDNGNIVWKFYPSYAETYLILGKATDSYITYVNVLGLSFDGCSEMHYHDDNSLWHCPMCIFARFDKLKGGASIGLSYPYWEFTNWDKNYGELAFSPYVKSNGFFESERAFITPYKKENKEIISHGPYPGKRKQKYDDLFGAGGLGQHFKGNTVPDDVGIPDEALDAGEIRSMRKLLRELLPESPLPEDGYFIWQNGWWAGLFSPDAKCLDPLIHAGINDIMTAATYYGHANHPSCEPAYIKDTLKEPLRFPVCDSDGVIATTVNSGLHHNESSEERDPSSIEYVSEFAAPKQYEKLIEAAHKSGMYVSSFSTPNNSFVNYPEWISRDENGNAHTYFGTKVSCPACKEYMDHQLNVLTSIIDKYKPRFWGFDGRWSGYLEFAGYGNDEIKPSPCYCDNHGHLPGKSQYMEWKNIMAFKRALRLRYPNLCLEEYYGLKVYGTWGLRYFNSDENYYEVSSPDNNRLQAWHNENDRFRPTYMNFATISGKNAKEFEYAMVSSISLASYAQVGSGFNALRDDEATAPIFRFWKSWADKNSKYLKDKEFLFDCPGNCAVDGSSHIIDGEGVIFLFNTVDFETDSDILYADIFGLDGEYDVFDISFENTTKLNTFSDNNPIKIHMTPHTFKVLELKKK